MVALVVHRFWVTREVRHSYSMLLVGNVRLSATEINEWYSKVDQVVLLPKASEDMAERSI